MVVTAAADGFWQNNAGGEDCLVNVEKVTPPCDFSNQNRGESFRPQLFVNAKKIDLGAFYNFLTNTEIDGHSRDEG